MSTRGIAGMLLLLEAADRLEGKAADGVEANVRVRLEQVLEVRKRAGR
jgi:hypothetical protein